MVSRQDINFMSAASYPKLVSELFFIIGYRMAPRFKNIAAWSWNSAMRLLINSAILRQWKPEASEDGCTLLCSSRRGRYYCSLDQHWDQQFGPSLGPLGRSESADGEWVHLRSWSLRYGVGVEILSVRPRLETIKRSISSKSMIIGS